MSIRSAAVALVILQTVSGFALGREEYRLTFESRWSAETHPGGFPNGGHFTKIVGGNHTTDHTIWSPGTLATPGVWLMAELGGGGRLLEELRAARADGKVDQLIFTSQTQTSPDQIVDVITVQESHPVISGMSMVAPSPDWFVGFHDINLLGEDGEWVGRVELEAHVYDAGSDGGPNFGSPNTPLDPHEPVAILNRGPFANDTLLGRFVFLHLIDGDFSEDGYLGAADIDLLTSAIRSGAEPKHDLDGSGTANADDVVYWVEELKQTYFGDANLDGEFNSTDLVEVFRAGEYDDATPMNSGWSTGDWDGNGDFESSDLVFAFQSGAYEQGPRAAAAVPEPTGATWLPLAGIGMIYLCRRRLR